MKLTSRLNYKRNPIAASLRNFKASKHKSKRSNLTALHAWHDMVEATRKDNDYPDFRDTDIHHWHDEVYDRDCGSYWND